MPNNDLSRPHVFSQGTSSRTILALHGTGGDEHNILGLAKALDPTASILSPRGMHLEGGMNRFFERYADGTFNEQSIDIAVNDLADFIVAAVNEYGIDVSNIFATGFSNGANTASALMIRRPQTLVGAALFGSTIPFAEVERVDLSGKKIWLANGDHDSYAPVDVSERWVDQLRGFGADVTWLQHPGGHQIEPEHVNLIADQLRA
jgi:phospholipase/carboxylesterase